MTMFNLKTTPNRPWYINNTNQCYV